MMLLTSDMAKMFAVVSANFIMRRFLAILSIWFWM